MGGGQQLVPHSLGMGMALHTYPSNDSVPGEPHTSLGSPSIPKGPLCAQWTNTFCTKTLACLWVLATCRRAGCCLVWNDVRLDLVWDIVSQQGSRTGWGREWRSHRTTACGQSFHSRCHLMGAKGVPGACLTCLIWEVAGRASSLRVFTGLEHVPDISMHSPVTSFKKILFLPGSSYPNS